MEPDLLEAETEQLARAFGGVAMALRVRVEAPADLALAALGVRQLEHELADHPAGFGLDGRQEDAVSLGVDLRLSDTPLEQRLGRLEVHRLPAKVPADVVASEHGTERLEVVSRVWPQRQPRGRERIVRNWHRRTILGGRSRHAVS